MKNMFQPKIIECMKHYSKQQLIKDIFAGMLVAVIAFPLSVALAISSGLAVSFSDAGHAGDYYGNDHRSAASVFDTGDPCCYCFSFGLCSDGWTDGREA